MEKDDKVVILPDGKDITIPPPGDQTFYQKYGVVLPYVTASIGARLGYLAYKKYKASKKDDEVKK
jgi:hypothetical protein